MPSFLPVKTLEQHPELAKALGEMVVAWANAESALLWALSHAAQIDANLTLTAYYRIPTFEARTKVLRAILQDDDCRMQDRDKIDAAVEKLAKLAKARNDWTHGAYFTDGSQIVCFDYRVAPSHPRRRKPVKAHDIANHVQAVNERTRQLEALLPSDAFFPSPRKSQ